tara:strand:- start:1293 stop:1931 length:639 start_codon:yes stop_codon:yes gene_type:complete
MSLIRIRLDDVFWESSDPKMVGREVQKVKKHIKWCENIDIPVTPAILCQESDKFPEGLDYLKGLIDGGKVYPDLHGWDHGPYGSRETKEIEEHLEKSLEWFMAKLGVLPIRWVTPHGADSPELRAAAAKFGMVLENTLDPVVDQKALDTKLRKTGDLSIMDGKVMMIHWFERGLRLYRIARIIEFGSIDLAIEETKSELSTKDHKICWNGWH